MSIAVYNSSDVDISDYLTNYSRDSIQGLARVRDINNQITLPSPEITVHTLSYSRGDEIFIKENGVKIYHLYIYDIEPDEENAQYIWSCRDILHKLTDKKVSGLSTSWWTVGSWHSPSTWEYRSGPLGTADYYIAVIFMLKVMIHQAEPDLSYADIVSQVDTELSPYSDNTINCLQYKYLGFQFNMFKFIGRPSNSEDEWDCLNLFEVLNWILDTMKLHLEYSGDKYYIKTEQSYTFPNDDDVYQSKPSMIERYGNIHVQVAYAAMGDYASASVALDTYAIDPTNPYEGAIKSTSLPNSFYVYEIYDDVMLGRILGTLGPPTFERQYFDVALNYFFYDIYTSEIHTVIGNDNSPYENEIDVENDVSIVKCKDPEYGLPQTFPIILR